MSAQREDGPDEVDDGQWRFGLDDVDENGIVEAEADPIEPGSPSAENAAFVVLGALLTLALVYLSLTGVF